MLECHKDYESLSKLKGAAEYWQQFTNLEGFDLLPPNSQRSYAIACYSCYDHPIELDSYLEKAQAEIENIIHTSIELATSIEAPQADIKHILAASTTASDSSLLADESEACHVNSQMNTDNQAVHTHTPVEAAASTDDLDAHLDLFLATSSTDQTSTDTPKTEPDAATVLPERMTRETFRDHYKLDDGGYGNVRQQSKQAGYWTASDGRQWSVTGDGKKAVLSQRPVGISANTSEYASNSSALMMEASACNASS